MPSRYYVRPRRPRAGRGSRPALSQAEVDRAVAQCFQDAADQEMDAQAAYGKALVARFGPGVLETIRDTTIARARQGQESTRRAKRDLDTLKAQLWDRLGPRFEWSLVEKAAGRLRFEVRKCPFASAMRSRGAAELGFARYCAYDIGFCQGFNPAIRFTRTRTLMMGDCVCDHAYELPAAASQGGTPR